MLYLFEKMQRCGTCATRKPRNACWGDESTEDACFSAPRIGSTNHMEVGLACWALQTLSRRHQPILQTFQDWLLFHFLIHPRPPRQSTSPIDKDIPTWRNTAVDPISKSPLQERNTETHAHAHTLSRFITPPGSESDLSSELRSPFRVIPSPIVYHGEQHGDREHASYRPLVPRIHPTTKTYAKCHVQPKSGLKDHRARKCLPPTTCHSATILASPTSSIPIQLLCHQHGRSRRWSSDALSP